ncbi:DMT family transporter [Prosthecomicrobium pneumaticum]|uniref:Drug/metabolite transporter (DMT)-like permease n=1 Tax=Prosthecomicrobium pneumaticum TaxID=81895 RepID=A0A7W9CUZ0_9HYPH|nr:DMT family transporter [Prosthecomicrobium pneumaticum]MBB5752164.1 drug/metabolite transporter (DMT)-like permease [Prosthecomicrobium pneumaticum]
MAPLDYGLYALTVFAWSTSWIALKNQLGVVAPEVSLVWRFGLSAILMFGWALLRGERMRFPLADHLRFAGLGVFIFSVNFVFFYHGGMALTSGLLAVIFSLASVFNMLLGAVFLGQRIDRRVLVGAAFGFCGVALMFWPEIAGTEFDRHAALGLALCIGGTLCFCTGNMISAVNQRRGLPVIPANAYGMAYGTLLLTLASLALGHAFVIEPTARYLAALGWLSVVSSVLAFVAYLTLLGRIGSARAGYSTVLFPVIALAISTVFEGYHWTAAAIAGLALVMIGNVIVLRR